MNLFENDIINITNIYSVQKFVTEEKDVGQQFSYSSDLPSYELVFFVNTESDVHYDGVNIVDRSNSVRFMPKGVKRGGKYLVTPKKAGYCIDIYFDTDASMPDTAVVFDNVSFLGSKFLKIYNIWDKREEDYYLSAMIEFYDIIKSLKKTEYEYSSEKSNKMIRQAYEYIKENFKNRYFDYDELCRKSGFASSYFRERFRKLFGMTPTKALNKMRMEYAEELLLSGRYTIGQISLMCGFENVYYFSASFKNYYGISPSRYKIT